MTGILKQTAGRKSTTASSSSTVILKEVVLGKYRFQGTNKSKVFDNSMAKIVSGDTQVI
jgi:hypothetical protein